MGKSGKGGKGGHRVKLFGVLLALAGSAWAQDSVTAKLFDDSVVKRRP